MGGPGSHGPGDFTDLPAAMSQLPIFRPAALFAPPFAAMPDKRQISGGPMALFKAAFCVVCLVAGSAGVAFAQQQQPAPMPFPNMMQGTPEEQRACAPDSARFCKKFEPDAFQVLGCLQQNRARISKACETVLRNRGV